jgi:hypothetical protein
MKWTALKASAGEFDLHGTPPDFSLSGDTITVEINTVSNVASGDPTRKSSILAQIILM